MTGNTLDSPLHPVQLIGGDPGAWDLITVRGMHALQAADVILAGHLPPSHERSLIDWEALARSGATLVVIMGVRNAGAIASALIDAALPPHTPVTAIQEGTLPGQHVVHTELSRLGAVVEEEGIQPPAVFVIGDVAGLRADS